MSSDLIPEGFKVLSAEASEEQIAQLIGIPYEVFTNTVIFAQATTKSTAKNFIDCTDGERKDLFRTMFNLQNYGDAYDAISKDNSEFQKGIEKLNSEIELANNSKGHLEQRLLTLEQTEKNFKVERESEITKRTLEISQLTGAISEEVIARHAKIIEDHEANVLEASTLEKHCANVEQQIKTNNTSLKSLEEQKSTLEIEINNLDKATIPKDPGDCEVLLKEQKELADTISELSEHLKEENKYLNVDNFVLLDKQVIVARGNLEKENSRISALKIKKQTLEQQLESLTECPTCAQSLTKELSKKVGKDILSEIESLNKELSSYKGSTTKAALEEKELALSEFKSKANPELAKEIEEALERTKEEKVQIEKQLQEFSTKQTSWNYYNAKRKQVEEVTKPTLRKVLESIEETTAYTRSIEIPWANVLAPSYDTLKNKISDNLEKVKQSKISIVEQTFKKQQLADNETALKELQQKIFPQRVELSETTNELQECSSKLKALSDKQGTLTKESKDFQNLISAFGNEGIVAELFKEYLPALQDLSNEYSLALTNNQILLDFEAEKVLKDKSRTRSQFSITIKSSEGGSNEFISGSEQRKAALICSLALFELASQYSNISTNIRVYDEIFDSLDQRSVERLVEFLSQKNDNFITFVISHKKDLEDSFVNKIELRKTNGATEMLL